MTLILDSFYSLIFTFCLMSTFSAVACSRVDTEILRECGQIVSNVNLKKHSNQSRFIELLQFKVVEHVWVIFFSNLLKFYRSLEKADDGNNSTIYGTGTWLLKTDHEISAIK